MIRELLKGAMAGSAGTSALNAATYLDMAVRARPTSSAPEDVVNLLADRAGHPVPGSGEAKDNRLEGLGALSGIATGAGVGAGFGWLRSHGLRLGPVLGPVVIGGAAMLATDAAMARLGISDPREWDAAAWLSDALPHLAFGVTTYAALVAMDSDG
jgi:protein involved in temperature-dependent protein secretion